MVYLFLSGVLPTLFADFPLNAKNPLDSTIPIPLHPDKRTGEE
jgi:hypothetical protein